MNPLTSAPLTAAIYACWGSGAHENDMSCTTWIYRAHEGAHKALVEYVTFKLGLEFCGITMPVL